MSNEQIKGLELNQTKVFENISESVLLLDTDCIIIAFNNKSKKNVSSIINEELEIGRNLIDYIERSKKALYKQTMLKVLNGEVVIYDRQFSKKSGKKVCFQFIINPVFDHNVITGISITGRDITRKKIIEHGLFTSQRKYQLLLNSIDGIVWEADANSFAFSFVTPSAERILGYPLRQWTRSPTFWKDHIHPEDREKAVAYCTRCIEQKRSHQLEYRMIARDGTIKYIHDNVTVIVKKDKVILLRGIMTDISERKNAENQLQESNNRLLFHLENSPLTFIEWDEALKPISWSKRAEEIFGWTEKEATSDEFEWFSKVFSEDLPLVKNMVDKLTKGEIKNSHLEHRCYAKDGSIVWCEWFNSVLKHYDKKITILSLVLDVTERKNAEDELKKLSMVAKETINGVVIRDQDQNVVWINNAFTKMYGYELSEIIGKDPTNFLPGPDTDAGLVSYVQEQFRKKEPFVFEMLHYTRSGGKMLARVQVQPIFNEKGEFIQSFALHTDITEQKRLEEQVKLEKIIKQNDITNAVFAAQEKERSEIGRELHDNVNQLLGATHLYIEMARNDNERKDSILTNASGFTLNAIEELRKLSKTLITPSIKNITLAELIKDLAGDIMLVHPVKISIITDHFSEHGLSDKFKLNTFRIVQEQINNILKHAKANNIIISIRNNFEMLMLSISDDGIGFDTTKRKPGMGITNIKSRSELYNGHVLFRSEKGHGTTLLITFNNKDLV